MGSAYWNQTYPRFGRFVEACKCFLVVAVEVAVDEGISGAAGAPVKQLPLDTVQ